MVVKIQKSSSKMKHVIDYNERKVEDMEASVIDYHLIQSPDRKTIEKAFERYEKANLATQNVSFHMSINPSPSDNMDEEQIKSLVAEILDELGYKDQPYVIYKHEDIEGTHYHVVSVRVNELGRKIKDFKDAYKCQKILEKLSQKYGYTIGKATEEHIIDVEEENKKKRNKNPDQPEKITLLTFALAAIYACEELPDQGYLPGTSPVKINVGLTQTKGLVTTNGLPESSKLGTFFFDESNSTYNICRRSSN